ncbi:MAG: TipAS antibiotic-recognition domain-containing protein, partial [Chloroflexota bacterium]
TAIDQQIESLQVASEALERALSIDDIDSHSIDDAHLNQVIRAVMFPQQEWIRSAFTDEAWAGITTRRLQYTEADFQQFERDWRELTDKFAELQHLPADSEPVQALADTMHKYISLFSAGDSEAEEGVRQVWQNRQQMPSDYQMADDALLRFIQHAYEIYIKSEEL